jgi:hypothetical protein
MKPATTTLAEIRGGLCVEELGEALRAATAAVKQTGKKAKVCLTLSIEVNGQAPAGEIESVFVNDDITLKLPVPKKRASIFFVNERDDLMRQQVIAGVEPGTKAEADQPTTSGRDRAAGKD